ncbi:MAG: endolytic transglycosylase MltG [Candidatus Actinomarina sp.]|tara:strand:- start:925 stop:1995 length:1071 start_codon:yes stop_codon:yes gene_type:complete
MNNLFLKNRTSIQLVTTLIFIYALYNFVTSTADSIEGNQINEISNQGIVEVITVNIPQGSAASEISSILDSTGIVSSKLAFELYLRNENLTDKLRAGTYELPNNLSFEEVTALLLKGPPLKTYTITVPEGLWISETLEILSAQTGYDVLQLENSLTSGLVTSSYLDSTEALELQNWEGLLFPNTYQIDIEANGEEILQIMVSELEKRYELLLSNYSVPEWINNSNEFFTVASLIEAEAKLDEDRPLVSSVIRNRLNDNMLLQIDAAVLYALQKRKSQVLLIDLQVDSPYNIYKFTGLPPTPISGFGEKAMQAIFDTPENDFIYYLLTDINGKMTFTNNYEDFINLKNKAKEEGVIP